MVAGVFLFEVTTCGNRYIDGMSQEIAQFVVIDGNQDVMDVDRALMVRLERGDAAAMTELVGRFGPGLSRLIGYLTAWHADADDILQEVLLTAWRKAHTFQGKGSLEGWLRRLAVNQCKNHRRARATFEQFLQHFAYRRQEATPREIPDYAEDPTVNVQRALSQLKSSDRAVLVLFYLEQLSGDQVARALDVRPETVHMRLHRARIRLRELMNHEDESTA